MKHPITKIINSYLPLIFAVTLVAAHAYADSGEPTPQLGIDPCKPFIATSINWNEGDYYTRNSEYYLSTGGLVHGQSQFRNFRNFLFPARSLELIIERLLTQQNLSSSNRHCVAYAWEAKSSYGYPKLEPIPIGGIIGARSTQQECDQLIVNFRREVYATVSSGSC
ncbi:MAG: hypothetical protein KDD70_15865, partial [Bdellovibrionales bacterium]|nr:hypothetical protein [Bdellovibrionales bacterium]